MSNGAATLRRIGRTCDTPAEWSRVLKFSLAVYEVGRVTAVRAWSQDPTKIEILLEVKEGTPVNENSVAKLGAVSLMSSPAISVTTGTNDARAAQAERSDPF